MHSATLNSFSRASQSCELPFLHSQELAICSNVVLVPPHVAFTVESWHSLGPQSANLLSEARIHRA